MTKIPFRDHHLLQLLEAYDEETPLDLFMHRYFREHRALGSKDRAYISDAIYALVRWRGLLDALIGAPRTWERRLDLWQANGIPASDETLPTHVRVSFPKALYNLLETAYGDDAVQVALACNDRAPTFVRTNLLKISRDELLTRWSDDYDVSPCQYSAAGIRFSQKTNFFSMPEFTKGFFEVQDEGSQLVADLVTANPGEHVLDYCAGSGGKTLAIAPNMNGKGQLYLHDIRPGVLYQARKRLKRAGIQNAQTVLPDSPQLKKLKGRMDWVLVDAPCSGTGTLRRNPDMKWKFSETQLRRLVGVQRNVFEKALSYLRPGGHIVYATCSILPQENQQQLEHFLNTYPVELVGDPFISIPEQGEMDGFFGAVMRAQP